MFTRGVKSCAFRFVTRLSISLPFSCSYSFSLSSFILANFMYGNSRRRRRRSLPRGMERLRPLFHLQIKGHPGLSNHLQLHFQTLFYWMNSAVLSTRGEWKREKSSLPLLIILSEYKPLLLLFVRNGRHLSQQIKQPVMYTLLFLLAASLAVTACSEFSTEFAVERERKRKRKREVH